MRSRTFRTPHAETTSASTPASAAICRKSADADHSNPAARPAPISYSGMFPCFLGGFLSRLVFSAASARTSRARVSLGRMTSSTYP
jgi:hypothetical protein